MGKLGFCQLISHTDLETNKQQYKNYFLEFRTLQDKVLKIIGKLKIQTDQGLETKSINFSLENLDLILTRYSERINIIEKEVLDIDEIESIIERDLREIIEKEEQYEKITRIKADSKKLSSVMRDKAEFEQDLDDLAERYHDELRLYRDNLSFIVPYLNATQKITQTKLFSIITCWVIEKKIPELEAQIQKLSSNRCMIVKEGIIEEKTVEMEEPPTVMKHSRILEPFSKLVRLYGIPSYYEYDPTKVIAITFPLLFGLMFGDIGQGFALMIGSAIIAFITKRTIPKILFYCGIAAMLMGFFYGDLFGFYLPEIWHGFQPLLPFPNQGYYLDISKGIGTYEGVIDNIKFMLKVAIIIGYIQISSGFFIQAKNFYKIGAKAKAWTISAPSFFLLTGMIVLLLLFGFHVQKYFAPHPYLLYMPPYFLILIPLLWLLIAGPIHSIVKKVKKIKQAIGETFLQTWEVMLSILTNLPSYARIFALIMIHYGLNVAFQAIGSSFENIILFGVMVGLGNAFTILLEVVIVSAHALRLHFYEWFSKFYEGGGTDFRPFKLPRNLQLHKFEDK